LLSDFQPSATGKTFVRFPEKSLQTFLSGVRLLSIKAWAKSLLIALEFVSGSTLFGLLGFTACYRPSSRLVFQSCSVFLEKTPADRETKLEAPSPWRFPLLVQFSSTELRS
jgi:hypothetical protein